MIKIDSSTDEPEGSFEMSQQENPVESEKKLDFITPEGRASIAAKYPHLVTSPELIQEARVKSQNAAMKYDEEADMCYFVDTISTEGAEVRDQD